MVSALASIFVLGLLVVVHEFGHFLSWLGGPMCASSDFPSVSARG